MRSETIWEVWLLQIYSDPKSAQNRLLFLYSTERFSPLLFCRVGSEQRLKMEVGVRGYQAILKLSVGTDTFIEKICFFCFYFCFYFSHLSFSFTNLFEQGILLKSRCSYADTLIPIGRKYRYSFF